MKETTTCNLAAQGNPILGGIESEEEDHHLGLRWPSSLPTQVSSHSHWGTTSSRAPPPPLLSWETPAGEAAHPGTGPRGGSNPTVHATVLQGHTPTRLATSAHMAGGGAVGATHQDFPLKVCERHSVEGQDWVDAISAVKCKECAS